MRHGFRIQKHDAPSPRSQQFFAPTWKRRRTCTAATGTGNSDCQNPKKKLPKGWFLNFHQIITTWTAWIFPGIKKIHDPFMAIYRTNQNVTVSCFFQKSGRQLKKKSESTSNKKTCFWIQFHPFETCWSKSQNAHAHLFCAPKPESSVCDGGCCPW